MCSPDEDRTNRLVALAGQRFDSNLLPSELKVIRRSVSDDPKVQEVPQAQQPVRPEFLRWLATDKDGAGLIDAKGIRVLSSTINGQLDLSFCRVPHMVIFRYCTFEDELLLLHSELRGLGIYNSRAAKGIVAHGAVLDGPLFLREGFQSAGSIDFHSARIAGSVQCDGTFLPIHGSPLSLEAATIRGDVFLTSGFQSRGEVRLLGANIGGDFNCSGASLSALGADHALSLDRAQIRGNVFFSNVSSSATLSLPGAEIGGQLNCRGAALTASATGLALDGATIHGGADLQDLKSSGELRFDGARIFGSSNFSNAVMTAQGNALSFDRASIQGSLFLRGLRSSGVVRLANAQIEHSLDCRGATLTVLYCPNMKLRGDFIWTSIQNPKETQLNLAAASIHQLSDDEASWPSQGRLFLNGLVYEQLSLHPTSSAAQLANSDLSSALPLDADKRIAWLRLQSMNGRIEPQPWMHLSELLEGKGDKEGAKHVVFALRQEQARQYRPVRRLWKILVSLLEERPGRVLWSLAILIILGTLIFWRAECGGSIAPTDRETYTAWANGKSFPSAYPRFNPIIYTVENALPLVKLGQDDKWAPDPSSPPPRYWFLAGFRWLLILLGWFQATLLAAAIGSRFKS